MITALVWLVVVPSAGAQLGFSNMWGERGSAPGQLFSPVALDIDPDGNVWVADLNNYRVQKFDPSGAYLDQFGVAGCCAPGAPNGEGAFYFPADVATDSSGNVYVTDLNFNRVQKFDPSGAFERMWGWGVDDGSASHQVCLSGCEPGIPGNGAFQLNGPEWIAVDRDDNVLVGNAVSGRVTKFTPAGTPLGSFGGLGSASGRVENMSGLAAAPDGTVYLAENRNAQGTPRGQDRIQRLSGAGAPISEWTTGLDRPTGLDVAGDGTVYVVEPDPKTIVRFSASGRRLATLGMPGSGPGQLNYPDGLAAAPGGALYVSEPSNERVQRWVPGGRPLLYSYASRKKQKLKRMKLELGCPLADCRAKLKGKLKVPRRGGRPAAKLSLPGRRVALDSGPLTVKHYRLDRRTLRRAKRLLHSRRAIRARAEVVVKGSVRRGGGVARTRERVRIRG